MKNFLTYADHDSALKRCIAFWILYIDGIILLFVSMILLSYASKFQISFLEYVALRYEIIILAIFIGVAVGHYIGSNKYAYHSFILKKKQYREICIHELKIKRDNLINNFDSDFERVMRDFGWGVNGKKMKYTPSYYFSKVWSNFTKCDLNYYDDKDLLISQKIYDESCGNVDLENFNENSFRTLGKLYANLMSQWRVVYQRKVDKEQKILDNLECRLID